MKRILLSHIPEDGELVTPDREESHHLLKVRRTNPDEVIEVLDGDGGLALGELVFLDERKVQVRIVQRLPTREPPWRLELALAIPVQISTIDTHLPSLVQLGVSVIHLVNTEYGGRLKKAQDKYKARLRTICLQSLKQCGRTRAPQIFFHEHFDDLCALMAKHNERNIMLHPVPSPLPRGLGEIKSLGLLVGPEGGFTENEFRAARNLEIHACGLGPIIQKMETAMIGACFWAGQALG